ncbi:Hypothetical protein, putative [Bodo saltans]|uniref:Uncharacterized protein n=1 Tax=Bodo saltans TaxID=75058 RepID=A0A0S4IYV5_BODSA|nr:Hypothetical protein, putative [Bodo saltans]|eukprot:CUG60347.1 Hypothetical protein, putative [Bodo saltans]
MGCSASSQSVTSLELSTENDIPPPPPHRHEENDDVVQHRARRSSLLLDIEGDDDDIVFPMTHSTQQTDHLHHALPSPPALMFRARESPTVPPLLQHTSLVAAAAGTNDIRTAAVVVPDTARTSAAVAQQFGPAASNVVVAPSTTRSTTTANPAPSHHQQQRKKPQMKASGFKTIPGIGSAMARSSHSFLRVLPIHNAAAGDGDDDEHEFHVRGGDVGGGLGDPLSLIRQQQVSSSLLTPFSSTGSFPINGGGGGKRSHPRSTSFTEGSSGLGEDHHHSSSVFFFAPPPPLLPQWPAPSPPAALGGSKMRVLSILGGSHKNHAPPALHDTLRPRAGDNSPPMPPTVSSSSVVTPTASTTVFAEDDDDDDGLEAADTTADTVEGVVHRSRQPTHQTVMSMSQRETRGREVHEPMANSARNEYADLDRRLQQQSNEGDIIVEEDVESGAFYSGSYSTGGGGSKRPSSDTAASIAVVPDMRRASSSLYQPMLESILSNNNNNNGGQSQHQAAGMPPPSTRAGSVVRIVAQVGHDDASVATTGASPGVFSSPSGHGRNHSTGANSLKSSGTNAGMFVPKPPPHHHHHHAHGGSGTQPPSSTVTTVTDSNNKASLQQQQQQPLFRWHPLRSKGGDVYYNSINVAPNGGGDAGGDDVLDVGEDDEEDGRVVLLESMSTASTATTIQSKRSGIVSFQKTGQHHNFQKGAAPEDASGSPGEGGGDRGPQRRPQQLRSHRHGHPNNSSSPSGAQVLLSSGATPSSTIVVPDLPGSPPRSGRGLRHNNSNNSGTHDAAVAGAGLLSAFSSPVGVLSREESARGSSGGWWSSVSSYSETPISSAPQSPRR